MEYRGRGLSTECGAALILKCLRRGLYPSWDAHDLRSVAQGKLPPGLSVSGLCEALMQRKAAVWSLGSMPLYSFFIGGFVTGESYKKVLPRVRKARSDAEIESILSHRPFLTEPQERAAGLRLRGRQDSLGGADGGVSPLRLTNAGVSGIIMTYFH